jgi:carbonic anhydrase
MHVLGKIRWDLGISTLRGSWRSALKGEGLREDAVSALSVALLAIPLSLAIGLASGVPPGVALVSAVVGGMLAAALGGTPLAVTGPAAAMAVLVASIVESHGLGGLVVVTLLAGALQVLMGVLGFGRIARLVPLPVIEGFTAGIGAIILVGQLPRALGLAPPPESHVVDVLTHIGQLFHQSDLVSVAVAATSLALCLVAPRVSKRIPGPLLAVVLPTAAVALFGLDLTRIGAVPSGLPPPSLPRLDHDLASYLSPVLMVFALASLESLLSSAALDKLARGQRHDPDQEFVGQGIANVGSALFGGIPVTSVIARSALNVHSGARTRRSAFLHAVIVLGLVLGAAPWLSIIPVAALAGVLMSVALRMLDPRGLVAMYRASRADAGVYLVTFVLMVSLDLIQGVQWGLGAALLVAAYWSTRHHARLHRTDRATVHRLVLEGPLTFLSSMEFDSLRSEAGLIRAGESAVLDLSAVRHIDATGAENVCELSGMLLDQGVHVVLLGMGEEVKQRVLSFDDSGRLAGHIADSELDLEAQLPGHAAQDAGRLGRGVDSYRRTQLPRYESLFKKLADSQSPHTLFITCADSRVVPNLITMTEPGELFIMRNVGNMIPPFGPRETPGTAAGVEYAVGVLSVADVVVCGHSGCGAIRALRDPSAVPPHLPSLVSWLNEASARKLCDHAPATLAHDDVARMSVLLQIDNLRSYPVVRERESKGELRLRAWFFDIGTGMVEFFDGQEKRWRPLAEESEPEGERAPDEARAGSVLPTVGAELLAVRAAMKVIDEQA